MIWPISLKMWKKSRNTNKPILNIGGFKCENPHSLNSSISVRQGFRQSGNCMSAQNLLEMTVRFLQILFALLCVWPSVQHICLLCLTPLIPFYCRHQMPQTQGNAKQRMQNFGYTFVLIWRCLQNCWNQIYFDLELGA